MVLKAASDFFVLFCFDSSKLMRNISFVSGSAFEHLRRGEGDDDRRGGGGRELRLPSSRVHRVT